MFVKYQLRTTMFKELAAEHEAAIYAMNSVPFEFLSVFFKMSEQDYGEDADVYVAGTMQCCMRRPVVIDTTPPSIVMILEDDDCPGLERPWGTLFECLKKAIELGYKDVCVENAVTVLKHTTFLSLDVIMDHVKRSMEEMKLVLDEQYPANELQLTVYVQREYYSSF